jgi:K+-sensing histidine kinase KdpD
MNATNHDIPAKLGRFIELIEPETPDAQLELELLDLHPIICAVTEYLIPAIHSKRQKLVTNLSPNLPSILADSLRVEQILLNLLSYASKNTPPGEPISLSANEQGDCVFIEIRYGRHTTPQERLYHTFQSPQEPSHEDTSGVRDEDLNFALCQYFVELHGGVIQAKNEEKEANAFSLFLPFTQRHKPS